MLPKDSIIGISASTLEEAQKAIVDGADYLGIGTMFSTPTWVIHSIHKTKVISSADQMTVKQIPDTP